MKSYLGMGEQGSMRSISELIILSSVNNNKLLAEKAYPDLRWFHIIKNNNKVCHGDILALQR